MIDYEHTVKREKKYVHFCFDASTNNKNTLKIFSHIGHCRVFYADYFGKKVFHFH